MRVKLHVHNTAHIVHQIAQHELDLGLIEGDCQHPDLEVQPWIEDELVVFCAPQRPLAGRDAVDLAELSGEAWILRERNKGTRMTFEQAVRHRPGKLNVRLELEHTGRSSVPSNRALASAASRDWRYAMRSPQPGADVDTGLDATPVSRHTHKYRTAAMREFVGTVPGDTSGVRRGVKSSCRRSPEAPAAAVQLVGMEPICCAAKAAWVLVRTPSLRKMAVMGLDGRFGNAEFIGDLLVQQAIADHRQDAELLRVRLASPALATLASPRHSLRPECCSATRRPLPAQPVRPPGSSRAN